MMTVKKLLGLFLMALLTASTTAYAFYPGHEQRGWNDQWVATWASPPMAAGSVFFADSLTFENQTVRQVVHISAGGQRIRIRLSNAYGTQPLRIGAAHVARYAGGAAIVAGTDRTLKFSGQSSITIPAGAVALSDPIDMFVQTRADLTISLYLPTNTGPATYHNAANQTAYISGPGDFTSATNIPDATTSTSRFFLSVVEVASLKKVSAVVAIGDSVTEGKHSTNDANHRWPDFLSARLNDSYWYQNFAVINQGIGCGRLLQEKCGPSAAARFDRDVLSVTGASHVIVALGLVDIILPTSFGFPEQAVSADEIIVGLKQLIERAHAQHLVVYGATITPFGAAIFPGTFTPENEAKRQTVNHWIRTSHAFDGVIDFDVAVRDPNTPNQVWAIYDAGDGIHMNDAGYEAMANSIDLSLFEARF